jgi:deoxyribodipyrimidine photo-lyase
MRAEGYKFANPSLESNMPAQTHDFKSTRLSKKLANKRIKMRAAWLKVSESEFAFHYQRQLLVRDFFSQFEEVPLRAWDFNPWSLVSTDEQLSRLKKWKQGETGEAIVDASMLQLQETGFISNRQRMICASYLSKNLLVYWRRGENHFAKLLEDYNFYSNVGNWCWVSGAGFNTRLTDVMSPEIQAKIIDPRGTLRQEYLGKDYKDLRPTISYKESKAKWLKTVL